MINGDSPLKHDSTKTFKLRVVSKSCSVHDPWQVQDTNFRAGKWKMVGMHIARISGVSGGKGERWK